MDYQTKERDKQKNYIYITMYINTRPEGARIHYPEKLNIITQYLNIVN